MANPAAFAAYIYARLANLNDATICHRLPRFLEDLNMIAMIDTSDQPCWLAEACKILLHL